MVGGYGYNSIIIKVAIRRSYGLYYLDRFDIQPSLKIWFYICLYIHFKYNAYFVYLWT